MRYNWMFVFHFNIQWTLIICLMLLKDALPSLRQFLATGSLLKILKKCFLFHLKSFLFSRYLNSFLDFLVMSKKIKTYDLTTWEANNWKTHIVQYLKNGNQITKFGQLIGWNKRIYFWKITHKMWWRNYSQTLFSKIKIDHISGSIV